MCLRYGEETHLGSKERPQLTNRSNTNLGPTTHVKKKEGGMDTDTFDMVVWDDIQTALKRTLEMFKIWHTQQGSGL